MGRLLAGMGILTLGLVIYLLTQSQGSQVESDQAADSESAFAKTATGSTGDEGANGASAARRRLGAPVRMRGKGEEEDPTVVAVAVKTSMEQAFEAGDSNSAEATENLKRVERVIDSVEVHIDGERIDVGALIDKTECRGAHCRVVMRAGEGQSLDVALAAMQDERGFYGVAEAMQFKASAAGTSEFFLQFPSAQEGEP